MKKKKNRFLLFCLSFLPGAGEMYLGFMKTGVSLLGLFAFSIMLTVYSNIGVMGLTTLVIYAYGFFHANNLGALSDEEFYRMEDEYLFGMGIDAFRGKYQKVFAILLIVLGSSILWQTLCNILYRIVGGEFYNRYIVIVTNAISRNVPRVIIGVVIIWFGIKLIIGKKAELDKMENAEEKQFGENMQTGWTAHAGETEQTMQAGQTGWTAHAVPTEWTEQAAHTVPPAPTEEKS